MAQPTCRNELPSMQQLGAPEKFRVPAAAPSARSPSQGAQPGEEQADGYQHSSSREDRSGDRSSAQGSKDL